MTPRLAPVSRVDLIRRLRRCGFEGPYSGGKHAFMTRGTVTVRVPNPHESDIGIGLLRRFLNQADVSLEVWMKTK